VVDDTVLSYADDKTGHMLSRLFLEPELQGEIKEPNFYFDLKEPKSAEALDMLVGARGWRMFEWKPIVSGDWRKIPATTTTTTTPDDSHRPTARRVLVMPQKPKEEGPPIVPKRLQPQGIPACNRCTARTTVPFLPMIKGIPAQKQLEVLDAKIMRT
jgi:hypothetical protein